MIFSLDFEVLVVRLFDACDQYWSRLFDWQPATDFPDFSTCLTAIGEKEKEREKQRERERERERANVIAMRPKLTKQKPQQKQTMRTALKFFKKFHVPCRSYSPDSLPHSYSFSPTLGVCYNLLYLFLLGDARRDATTTTTTGKYLRRCFFFFFFFLFFFFFFWGYLAFAGELGNLLNCAMKRNFLSHGGVGKEKLGKTIKLVQQCNGIADEVMEREDTLCSIIQGISSY